MSDGEGAPDPNDVIGPDEPPADPAGDVPAGDGTQSKLMSALRSTHPNPPIGEVGSLRDIREHYEAYGLRGLEKMAGADDAEAWVDLLKAAVGFMLENSGEDTSEEARREAEEDGATVTDDIPAPGEL